ncbi:hypothetical protein [Rubinisphaera sp.]|uniref:hypothetical protein n=1 Tax=Rubinisphaera sp. TaxID=2024857 RepID=UPI000C0D482B|nr:hypothetical protein [Rubinisphaera sp.]MBV12396.1 hypothetical protein [Rubinisphaera sp.]HCS50105.1 hypothetical protein [Planctomycetaceae bacterium]|tara:strand:+ start:6676 stop:7434 length:759 start_codon:yes stop_codon:yes gene_type:complete
MTKHISETLNNKKDALSPEDQVLLTECETIIVDGQKAFIRTCVAIVTIDKCDLFRPHKSLHAYCAFRFDFSDTETGRYRNAGIVLLNLSGLSAEAMLAGKKSAEGHYNILPANEGQSREMAKLKDAELQNKVWGEVIALSKKMDGKITAKLIKEVIEAITGDGGSDDGDGESTSPSPDKPCSAKLSIRFEEDENFDLAQPLKDAAEYFGVKCMKRKNNLTLVLDADSKVKLLHKLADWAAKYDVTRIVVDFS